MRGTRSPKYCKVAPNILIVDLLLQIFPYTQICTSSHAPSRKHQVTPTFKDHPRILCPQYGICSMSTFEYIALEGIKKVNLSLTTL